MVDHGWKRWPLGLFRLYFNMLKFKLSGTQETRKPRFLFFFPSPPQNFQLIFYLLPWKLKSFTETCSQPSVQILKIIFSLPPGFEHAPQGYTICICYFPCHSLCHQALNMLLKATPYAFVISPVILSATRLWTCSSRLHHMHLLFPLSFSLPPGSEHAPQGYTICICYLPCHSLCHQALNMLLKATPYAFVISPVILSATRLWTCSSRLHHMLLLFPLSFSLPPGFEHAPQGYTICICYRPGLSCVTERILEAGHVAQR